MSLKILTEVSHGYPQALVVEGCVALENVLQDPKDRTKWRLVSEEVSWLIVPHPW